MSTMVELDRITKSFRVYYDKGRSLKEKILFRNRNRYEERCVLNGISFKIQKGEAVGLVGQNGCGKSTTLKLINKIIYPDSGDVVTHGRISSLIELGAGFHPDMTGRENIYTNASILGLTHKEINERLNDIIEFSEMEEFLDNPVRTYSSGMYMRLAFAVAINVNADILLIDEILGVGDVSFQKKCFEKLREIKASGTTIVIVSHSLSQLEQICDRSIWFEDGNIREDGIPKYVHEHYLASMEEKRLQRIEEHEKKDTSSTEANTDSDEHTVNTNASSKRLEGKVIPWSTTRATRRGSQQAFFKDAFLTNSNGQKKNVFKTEETITLHLYYHSNELALPANIGYAIYRDDGLYCYGTNCIFELNKLIELKGDGEITVQMPNIKLLPNKYMIDIGIQSKDGVEYDNICFAIEFYISFNKQDTGVCRIDSNWNIQ
jgi:hypothetical protein